MKYWKLESSRESPRSPCTSDPHQIKCLASGLTLVLTRGRGPGICQFASSLAGSQEHTHTQRRRKETTQGSERKWLLNMQGLSLRVFVRWKEGRKTMHDLLTIKKKKPTQGEVPGGNTRPEELFTVFTGIILTAEIERARKGSAVAANTKG